MSMSDSPPPEPPDVRRRRQTRGRDVAFEPPDEPPPVPIPLCAQLLDSMYAHLVFRAAGGGMGGCSVATSQGSATTNVDFVFFGGDNWDNVILVHLAVSHPTFLHQLLDTLKSDPS